LGSEGTLGVVTEVVLRLHPLPAERVVSSFAFSTFGAALDVVRRVLREGWRPAVLRAYDAVESARQFSAWTPADHSLLLIVSEGPSTLVAAETAACTRVAATVGGTACGPEPATHWLEVRNTVPSWDFFLDAWGRALQATLDAGGTISHHHGIGRLRAGWLERELASAYPLLRDVKRALDPSGIMNPGALIPSG